MNEQIEGALLPCPFCGKIPKAEVVRDYEGVPTGDMWIGCDCKAYASEPDSYEECVKHWNTRSAPVVVPAVSGRADQDEASRFMPEWLAGLCDDASQYIRDNFQDWKRDDTPAEHIWMTFRTWIHGQANKRRANQK